MHEKVPADHFELINIINTFNNQHEKVIGLNCGYGTILKIKEALEKIITTSSNTEIINSLISQSGESVQIIIKLKNWE